MRRAPVVLAACVLALVLACLLGVSFGTDPVSLSRALSDPSSGDHVIVFEVRLPRVLLAAVAGAGLSVTGAALQALLRNPLAEPFVLGVSGGSALGATVAILLGVGGALGASVVPLAALAGGVAATAFVHAFAAAARGPRGTNVLLSGVVVNAIAASAITFLKTLAQPAKAQELLFWLVGYVGIPSRASLVSVSVYVAIGVAVLCADAARLNLLSLGDEAAAHLGVRVRALEIRVFVACSLVVGAIVSVTGLIGFVGLIAPHLLRRVLGSDARLVLPASVALGGAALVLCDLLSRASFRWLQVEAPVGAVTALIGGPLFLAVLRRRG